MLLKWCPAAESNYGLNLTMVPLYRLTSGATPSSESLIDYKDFFYFTQGNLNDINEALEEDKD